MSGKLNPSSLSIEDAVKVLHAAGSQHVSEETLRSDIEAGAPVNPDGTVNLVHYAAWMVKEMARGSD